MPPDVRVRLSAEGVAEVVSALEKVRAKSEQAAGTSAKAFGGLNKALAGTKALLTQLGVVLSVGFAIGVVKSSIEAADALDRMKQSGLGAASNIQAVAAAAKRADVDTTLMARALGLLAKNSTDVLEGAGKIGGALRAIGLSGREIQDLAGKDTAERFGVIAEKFAGIEDDAKKTTLAVELFGQKLGPGLIPLLNELGKTGIDPLKKRLEDLGVLMSDDVVASLSAVDDNMASLGGQARGLAGQFAGGLAPALLSTINTISERLKGSGQIWQEFGAIVGGAIRVIATLAIPPLNALILTVKEIADAIGGAVAVIKRLILGDFSGAVDEAGNRMNAIHNRAVDFVKGTITTWKNIWTTPTVEATKAAQKAEADLSEIYKQRNASLQAQLAGEIALIKAQLKAREDAESREFERGLLAIHTYYLERQKIVIQSTQAEILAIQKKALLEQQVEEDAGKRRAIAAKADAEIQLLNFERHAQLAALDDEELRRTKDAGEKAIDIETKIQEAQGNRHAVAIANIQREIEEARKVLTQTGAIAPGDTDDQMKTIARLQAVLEIQDRFSRASQATNEAITDFGSIRARIEDEASLGLISQAESEAKLLQLEKERLAVLQERAGEALRLAQESENPENIAQAQAAVDSIEKISLAVQAANDGLRQTGAFLVDSFGDSLVRVLGEGEIASLKFSSVFKSVLLDVSSALRRFLTQLLVTRAIMALFGGGGGGGGTGAFAGVKGGPSSSIPGFDAGGVVTGPGTATSDSIIGRLSAGEYVVRAAAVAQPGILQALETINRGTPTLRTQGRGHALRFAEGGLVPPGSGSGGSSDQAWLRVGLQKGLMVEMIRSPEGRQAFLEVVQDNARAFGSALKS